MVQASGLDAIVLPAAQLEQWALYSDDDWKNQGWFSRRKRTDWPSH